MKIELQRQQGVVLLLLLLVLVVSASTLALSTANSRQTLAQLDQSETFLQLEQAKAALLAYAATTNTLYDNLRGPAFLPCPDTDNDGVADSSCESNNALLGRLPEYIVVDGAADERFYFNSYFAPTDRQFWYAVGPRYTYSSTTSNRRSRNRTSSTSANATPYRLFLDGQSEYIAVLLAPGRELEGQNRATAPTTFGNYLEGGNGSSNYNYFSHADGDPEVFNDIVIGITLDELMIYVGMAVSREVKRRLDIYHTSNGSYPSSSTSFRNAFDNEYFWLRESGTSSENGERWSNYITYTRLDPDSVRINYNGCTGMRFEFTYTGNITLTGTSC